MLVVVGAAVGTAMEGAHSPGSVSRAGTLETVWIWHPEILTLAFKFRTLDVSDLGGFCW